MARALVVPADTVKAQEMAADPGRSAWVSANAGSGKTFVLTRRVLRLLLAGTPPEAILCLTYTKAAAAEMRLRLSARLGAWATEPEAALADDLTRMGVKPEPRTLRMARTLFARALETPGGLKIVTIHAFCEGLLHRFALEAGVPFDFKVIEETESSEQIAAFREAVIAEGLRGEGPADAVAILMEGLGDTTITKAIDEALARPRLLRPILADRAAAAGRLARFAGHTGRSIEAIEAEMLSGRLVGDADIALMLDAMPEAKWSAVQKALAATRPHGPTLEAWQAVYLTKGEPRKTFGTKALAAAVPGAIEMLEAEAQRLAALVIERRTAMIVARSNAVVEIVAALLKRYSAYKRARALLDFDDLIDAAAKLLSSPDRAWVQFKLDAGIAHVLVDESQDTNPDQWRVIDPVIDEFFAGQGQVERIRTVFAVGDPKQSIYSFQGADPELFMQSGRALKGRAREAGYGFEDVALHTSFRTLRGILTGVDRTFADPELHAAALASDPIHHDTARAVPGGRIVLWPLAGPDPMAETDGRWPLAPLLERPSTGPRRLALEIVARLATWIDTGRRLPDGRAITPDDVMILVSTRGAVFDEVLRALGERGIATPGADRLSILDTVAVLDLLALGDVLLNPADDLQLAAVLRSPLFDVDEDLLFALAHDRRGTLFARLAASDDPRAREAHQRLVAWRRALERDRPYELYARVLYADGGLKRFHARLGTGIDVVLSEFLAMALAHDADPQPSLQGFLVATRRRAGGTIKRELSERGGGVRVMTVHGAKGLEAPIVILADSTAPLSKRDRETPVVFGDDRGPFLLAAGSKDDHTPRTLTLRDAAIAEKQREYWRRLYVAMTRAEDELYLAGAVADPDKLRADFAATWYGKVEAALGPDLVDEATSDGKSARVFAPEPAEAAPAEPDAIPPVSPLSPHDFSPLDLAPLPAPLVERIVTPSAEGARAGMPTGFETAAERTGLAEGARARGIALHALLDHLVAVPDARRAEVARAALEVLLPNDPEAHEAIAERALSILGAPRFARLFSPKSRGEVPFVLPARRAGAPVRIVGRLDRLVVDEAGVLVVDFKSDAAPPADSEGVPMAYRVQLGLYARLAGELFPDRPVAVAILWTTKESLMILDPALLEAAVSGFTDR